MSNLTIESILDDQERLALEHLWIGTQAKLISSTFIERNHLPCRHASSLEKRKDAVQCLQDIDFAKAAAELIQEVKDLEFVESVEKVRYYTNKKETGIIFVITSGSWKLHMNFSTITMSEFNNKIKG